MLWNSDFSVLAAAVVIVAVVIVAAVIVAAVVRRLFRRTHGPRLVEWLASRFDRLKAGGVATAATSKLKPFDSARGRPFDSVHERSFGGAYGCRAVSGHRTHRE
jgi:hypothetical protein